MKKHFIYLLLLPLLAFTGAHKFYVSVTNVNYVEKEDALQITTRVFIDDIEDVLKKRYGIDAKLATENEAKIADEYIEKYLNSKFLIRFDNVQRPYIFLGKKYDNDVMVCYLEITKIGLKQLKTLEVQNEVLTDLFDEQKNLVHIKWLGKKKSFVLIKENNKGMLNL
ncbi:MAG: hypothetical protein HKP38_10870 [Croceitalea sp.]|nr:hypothetical protein [Croceitalea sp.]